MKRSVILASLSLVLAGASNAYANPPARAVAAGSHSCGTVTARGTTFVVTIDEGTVSCVDARRVLKAFLSGGGSMHGPRSGPAYKQYWVLPGGWKCGHGAGGGGCRRRGTLVIAQAK